METKEGSGGWEVPKRYNSDALVNELAEEGFLFRKRSGGATVYLSNGMGDSRLHELVARNGFSIMSVTPADGPHCCKVVVESKTYVRNVEDGMEHNYRLEDD